MSGGDKKRKHTRSQGWEPAGSEFYQESYPMDAEEIMPQDPKHLATLLPSKQSRAGATLRLRTYDQRTATTRRWQATNQTQKDSTDTAQHRRPSQGEVQVSMLPDLSQNLSNEQSTWEEVMLIKAMPIPMDEKKKLKEKILNQPNLRLQGYEQFKWKRRKAWDHTMIRVNEMFTKVELWRQSLKHIEGNFGTGVVAYFLLLKWMFFLNLTIFISIFLFITLPTILLKDSQGCTEIKDLVNNASYSTDSVDFNFLDLFQGTGIVEDTALFYGFYPNETYCYLVNNTKLYYNLPLAYLLITLLYFLLSLINIVKSAARGFRERLIESEGQFYQYCNLIFGGWDFCIHNQASADIKHKALYNEIKATLETDKSEEERQNRTRGERYVIIFWRMTAFLVTVAVWGFSGAAIYFVFDISTRELEKEIDDKFIQFVYQFLPSFCIVLLNMIVPQIFKRIVVFEKYCPANALTFTLLRSVGLRLASLFVLYYSLFSKVTCHNKENCTEMECWENYVGQNIYKLLWTDFATHVFTTFFLNFPRALLAKHCNNKVFKALGQQTFELPKNVLDVVYSQTLCWFGFFYAPLLSAMASLAFFLIFYIKKFACMNNSTPSAVVYRASRSNSMFMSVLLFSFVCALLPIAFSVSEMTPSTMCGPFSEHASVWQLIVQIFSYTPDVIKTVGHFVTTAGFAIPMFVVLFLLLYYYNAINAANRHMVTVLKNQLVLEGHDKQFLLNRLSMFIKENQKKERHRNADYYENTQHRNISSSN
ncbi:unnamed protein product [Brassicogethes aeneus]|uniref:TMC domain-containing protein n=1 Tax=Brassicogethes aeneus TaxID=1431903 RepID=A0A9P0ANK7_BRAAE|nr:unnamed protein product [Brassicogethes aeneus]